MGGIPPDAGYEEVSFPSDQDAAIKLSINSMKETLTVKTQKKPGILKTPSYYSGKSGGITESGRLNTLAGYIPGETWQTTKNVQWNSTEDKDNWDSKIDESRVIKEFSYQYIKPEDVEDDEHRELTNLVQSRIRSFESSIDEEIPVKELLSMQEPLKISSSQAIEAHVSRVDSSRKSNTNIREFALEHIEQKKQNKFIKVNMSGEKLKDGSKSVKDLLADFERKSQLVRRQEDSRREEVKHRGVFSDTETLLYDTGSDLDQPDKSEEEINEKNNKLKNQVYDRAIERNTSDKSEQMVLEDSFNDSQETIDALDVDSTSETFARCNMTDSMITHGDVMSTGDHDTMELIIEDINPEEHYLPMSPRKAILDPNNDEISDSKMMKSLFANLRNDESSYVEMTQNGMSRSLLAPDGTLDSGDYSTLDASHYEFVCVADNKVEPVYMEVSQLADKEQVQENINIKSNLIKRDSGNSQSQIRSDLPDILTALKSDSSDADDESSKDLDSIDAPRHPRFSLSDTFRPASYYLGASRTMIAELHDSSDSELVSPPPIPTSPPPIDDLDSLDIQENFNVKKCSQQLTINQDNQLRSPISWNEPAGQVEHPRPPSRFSETTISSTFRDSRISLESASGSDSLELRNPDEEARHRKMKRRPVSDEVCEVLDSLDELESLGSRFDGASIDLDQYLEELQARDAFNVDLYTKDLSYNSIYGFNENMLVVDKIQKTTSQEIDKINLKTNTLDQPFQYDSRIKTCSASSLPSMRVSDTPPSQHHQHSQSFTGDAHYENVANFSPLRGSPAIRSSEGEKIREEFKSHNKNRGHQPQISHSRDSSYSVTSSGGSNSISANCQRPSSALATSMTSPLGSIAFGNHVNSFGPSNTSSHCDQRTRDHLRSANQDCGRYSQPPNHRSSSSPDSNNSPSTLKTTMRSARNSPGISYVNQQSEQETDQTGAPYYYSDLQAGVNGIDAQLSRPTLTLIAHTSRLPQLNNQRGDSTGFNKRNDIGRLVNPIIRQMPRRIEVDDIDEARKIAAELRKNSGQFLADSKTGLVDKRNFYESDTLRRVKSIEPFADLSLPDVSSVNLYPHGLRDKSGSQTHLATGESVQEFMQTTPSHTAHRRSRSLEGLLDDIGLQNLVDQRNRTNRVSSVPPTRTQEVDTDELRSTTFTRINSDDPFEADDPWEQDTLWRESLRRVSLRHARSLDNLDTPTRANEASNDSRTRPKITRGATYVNDSVVFQHLESPDIVTERPRVKRRTDVEPQVNPEDDGTYESLAMDRASGGYVWSPENESTYRAQPRQENSNHFLDNGNLPPVNQQSTEPRSFELDREKLRQWDLLSSACLLQEQQRNSMAESGRGLPECRVDRQDNMSTIMMMMTTKPEAGVQGEIKRADCKIQMIDDENKEMMTTMEKENGRGEWHFGTGAGFGK